MFREKNALYAAYVPVLADGGLEEEARPALLAAILPLARALAIESRLPGPASADDALLPPLSHQWKEAAPLLRNLVANPNEPLSPGLEALATL